MNRFFSITAAYFILLVASIIFAQDIYVYPNKKLADQGLIEYRRYTLEEARAYEQGGSFEPYLTTAWSTERQLTQQTNVYAPSVVTSGNTIYCGYGLMLGSHAYFIKSTNGGTDWEPYLTLVDTAHEYLYLWPQITQYGNNLLIGFTNQNHGNNLGFFKSTDNGVSWGSLRNILPSFELRYGTFSSFANSGRDLYAAYIDFAFDSIRVIRSWNFGVNWIGTGVNVAYLNGTPQPMSMAASDSIIHLVWVNENAPISIRYSRSTDNGVTWSPELDVSQDSLGAQLCRISADGQYVIASWMGYKCSPYMLTGDMFVRQSFDGGLTWDTAQALTESHKVTMNDVFIKDSIIVAGWMDSRLDNLVNIFVRYSRDCGTAWVNEEQASIGGYSSGSLSIFMIGQVIQVLWGDRRAINQGLYYNYNIDDGIDIQSIPNNYMILRAYPNPFNSSIILSNLIEDDTKIDIYNIAGQLIKTLKRAGKEGRVIWNGTDDDGQSLSSGIYLVVAKTPKGMQHLKVTFLK